MARWGDRVLREHLAAQAARAAAPKKPRRAKFNNAKVDQGGLVFDSAKEATRWRELEQLAAAGVITDLKRQVRYILAPAVRLEGEKRTKPALRYFADFTYMQGGQLVVEDAKSPPTRKLDSYRNKKHLMATVHRIHIKEV